MKTIGLNSKILTVTADGCLVAPAGLIRVHLQENVTLTSYKTSIISDNGDNLGTYAQFSLPCLIFISQIRQF